MRPTLKRLGKVAAYVLGTAVFLVMVFAGLYLGDAWLSMREWEISLTRIKPIEVEVYDVSVEADPQNSTDVVFTGRVRNNSKQFILADVGVQVMFLLCNKDATTCSDMSGWGGKALGVGWRLEPSKSVEFRYWAYIGDPRPTPDGKFGARVTVTSTRGLTR